MFFTSIYFFIFKEQQRCILLLTTQCYDRKIIDSCTPKIAYHMQKGLCESKTEQKNSGKPLVFLFVQNGFIQCHF